MILIIFLYTFICLSNLYSFIYVLFIFGCAASLLLHAGFPQLWLGPHFLGVCRLLVGVASFGRGHKLQVPGLGSVALRISFSALWGIFPDQGSNLGLLH